MIPRHLFPFVCATAAALAMSHVVLRRAAAAAPDKPAAELTCPAALAGSTFAPARVPPGWTGAMPQSWPLTGGGMVWGPPHESAYLKPREASTTKAGSIETGRTRWLFEVPHAYEVWISCAYGPLELYQRIPQTATECIATTRSDHGTIVDSRYRCR